MTDQQPTNDFSHNDGELAKLVRAFAQAGSHLEAPIDEEGVSQLLTRVSNSIDAADAQLLLRLANMAISQSGSPTLDNVIEVRPQELECDVVRFQNNKEKWVALVGLLNGYPYEIFTGLQDDDEGIMLPKSVTKGKIIKQLNSDGSKRYDFQFTNTRGYKITIEGLSSRFNPEYWNYAKLISGVLRYRMPIENVIKLVASLQLGGETINNWKNGVERALKKYVGDNVDQELSEDAAQR